MVSVEVDPPLLQLNEDNLRDLKEKIRIVDHSLTGLVLSIDSMQASCKVMFEQLASEDRNDSNDKKCASDQIDSVKQVLQTIEGSIENQKVVTVQSLSILLHLIANIFCDLKVPENIQNLIVDQYLRDKSMLQSDSGVFNSQLRLQEEVANLREINKTSDEIVENLRIRLKNEEDRTKVLEGQKADLDEQLTEIENENTEMKKSLDAKANQWRAAVRSEGNMDRVNTSGEIIETLKNAEQYSVKRGQNVQSRTLQKKSESKQAVLTQNVEKVEQFYLAKVKKMEQTIAGLESELLNATTKRQCYVQIYQKGYNRRIGDGELQTSLQNWIRPEDFQLKLIQCWVPSDIRPDTPLLLLFEGRRLSTESISDRLKECQAVEPWMIAVLIFHNNERDISANKHIKEEISHIGGIYVYDIIFSENKRQITSSDINTNSLHGILEMIKTTRSMKQLKSSRSTTI